VTSPFAIRPELHQDTTCPYCLTTSPVASNVTGESQPGDGHLTLCAECAGVSIFDFSHPGLRRQLTRSERESVDRDPDLVYKISVAQRYVLASRRPLSETPPKTGP
jgi:hypothetical protein